ncbi:MAG: fructose-bisphosphate aldolase, partial [Ignavibacteriae bacterium]
MIDRITEALGSNADHYLNHTCTTIPKEHIHLPNANSVDSIFGISDRNSRV